MPFLDLKNKKCWIKSFASLQYIIITMCNIYIYIYYLLYYLSVIIYIVYILYIYISFYLFIFLQIKILKIKPLINSFFYKFLDFYES